MNRKPKCPKQFFYKANHDFQTYFLKKMIEKLSKQDNHKILNVVQQEMKLVSDVASLIKYGQLD